MPSTSRGRWRLRCAAGRDRSCSTATKPNADPSRPAPSPTPDLRKRRWHTTSPPSRSAGDGPSAEDARRRTAEALAVKKSEFHSLGLVLGYAYTASPVVVPDGTTPPADDPVEYVPSACPGSLLPHAWLDDGRSLYDALGREYTLIVLDGAVQTPRHTTALDAVAAKAAEPGVPLTVLRLSGTAGTLGTLLGAPFVLVRPDQHVAWRGSDLAGAEKAIDIAAGW
ncbi:hypothetical protein ACFSUH_27150 [Rhodococcus jostii]|uniref:aromatic-ring hydroxylase C-terminal domain-containing protein n=1 Tax=Rhodococcus jostii TaxID=132919 RepID=UPI00363A3299